MDVNNFDDNSIGEIIGDNIEIANKTKCLVLKNCRNTVIGMIVGFAIGITLYFAIRSPGYDPFRLFVLLYLMLGFGSFSSYAHMPNSDNHSKSNDSIELFFNAVLFVILFIGIPIYTLVKVFVFAKDLRRIRVIKNSLKRMLKKPADQDALNAVIKKLEKLSSDYQ